MKAVERLLAMDLRVLLWAVAMSALGCIFVYSSSAMLAHRSVLYNYDPDYFFQKQVIAVVMGMSLCLWIGMYAERKTLSALSGWLLAFSVVLLALVFVPGIGGRVANVYRWVRIGGFSFQPSELAKVTLILYLANFIAKRETRMMTYHAVIKAGLAAGVVAVMINLEPDFSTTVYIGMLTLLMLFLGGISWTAIAGLASVAAAGAAVAIAGKMYILNRIWGFLNPWSDPGSKGFHILQSYISLARGELTGVGLGESVQKTALLPAPHTDFVYAVIGEEIGFVGATGVALAYLVILYLGVRIALNAKTLFYKLLAAGITLQIVIQAMMNMFVVTGMLPVTGESLPLLSAGGSSTLVTLIGVGLLLAVSREREA